MKKLISISILVVALMLGYNVSAQVSINTDGSEPDPTSMLDIKSSDKGLLIPRMTTVEIEAIYLPADGLQVYNTDNGKLYIFVENDYEWKEVSYATGNIQPNATYSIGTGNACTNTVVNGQYYINVILKYYDYISIEVNVSSLGQYSIITDTINGYSFSGTGIFTSTGIQTIDLAATGTPLAEQTDNFTATADNSGGTCSFQVSPIISPTFLCGMQFQDTRDGQMYNTVEIGTQCWMAENMNIGTMINSSTGGTNNDGEQTDNGTIEKYCNDNSTANCDVYGGLYQWNEAMEYISTEGIQGICPSNWHFPTENEWCILVNYVDVGTVSCSTHGLGGIDAGGNLKENGTDHWNSPNTGATNSSGFTALPGGIRYRTNGSFSSPSSFGYFWTSSEYASHASWCQILSFNEAQIRLSRDLQKGNGQSIRCLKD